MENNEWVKPYINKLVKNNTKFNSTLLEEKLKYINMPFYKYCYVNEEENKTKDTIDYSIENFKNNEIFFQNPIKFNDPFDCFLGFSRVQVFRDLLINELKRKKIYTPKIIKIVKEYFSFEEFDSSIYLQKLIKDNKLTEIILPNIPEIIEEFGEEYKFLKEVVEDIISKLDDKQFLYKFVENKLTIKDKQYYMNLICENEIFKELVKSKFPNRSIDTSLNMVKLKLMIETQPQFMSDNNIEKMDSFDNLKYMIQDEMGANINIDFESFDKLANEFLEKSRKTISNLFKVTCLSERMDSPLMWSHYANKHFGFCLEYDFTHTLIKNYQDLEFAQLMLFPVTYSQERPLITKSLFNKENIKYIKSSKMPPDFLKNVIIGLLFKSEDWAYEREWRILKITGDSSCMKLPPARKVFLGANMEDNAKNIVIEIAKSKNIPVYQMFLTMDKYKFDYYKVI